MGRKIWNVVLVPEGGGAVRNLRIPVRLLHGALVLLVVGLVIVAGSVGLHLWTLRGLRSVAALQKENASLRSHIAMVNHTLEQVETMVRDGERMERQARVLAGLDPVDGETRQLGVGGPLMESAAGTVLLQPEVAHQVADQVQRLDQLERQASFQLQSFQETLDNLRTRTERLAHTPSICPLRVGYVISSGFGTRIDPFTGQKAFHSGLDLRAAQGTPVHATAEGEVTFVGWDGEFGNCVRIRHGYGFETGYCHLSSSKVRVGQKVSRGEIIGNVGSSGRSTAPHLHYEVSVAGVAKNPSAYILIPRPFVD